MPNQWIAYDTPARDEWEALRRAQTDALCMTCGSTGLVCPTCRGARYVIHPDRGVGTDSRVVYCADCSGIVNDKRVTWDDSEQRAIALWLQAHRDTHPAIANPARTIEADPQWAAFQADQEHQRLAKRRADAEAAYAAYVQQWGDPRAAVLRGRSGRGKPSATPTASEAKVAAMAEAIIADHAKAHQRPREGWGVLPND